MKALWKGVLLAESDQTIVVEGNHYFPPESLVATHFVDSSTTSVCPWKGLARYKSIKIAEGQNPDACWFYPEPKEAAQEIRGFFAFWKGVEIQP